MKKQVKLDAVKMHVMSFSRWLISHDFEIEWSDETLVAKRKDCHIYGDRQGMGLNKIGNFEYFSKDSEGKLNTVWELNNLISKLNILKEWREYDALGL